MKHLQTFENYDYTSIDEAFLGIGKDTPEQAKRKEQKQAEKTESKEQKFLTRFKTVLTYYYKKKSAKAVKYWLESLATAPQERVSNKLNDQYDKLKPSFGASPGGRISSNSGNIDLIKKMKEDPTYFDATIAEGIEKYAPKYKEDLYAKLRISPKAQAQGEAQAQVQAPVQESVKRFNDFK